MFEKGDIRENLCGAKMSTFTVTCMVKGRLIMIQRLTGRGGCPWNLRQGLSSGENALGGWEPCLLEEGLFAGLSWR